MIIGPGASADGAITQGGNTAVVLAALADDLANTNDALVTAAHLVGFDGATWDRLVAGADSADAVAAATLGRLLVAARLTGFNGTTWDRLVSGADNADAVAAAALGRLLIASRLTAFNGATWDRWRNNAQLTEVASAARTASGNSGALTNYNGVGLLIVREVTLVSGTSPTLDQEYIWLTGASGNLAVSQPGNSVNMQQRTTTGFDHKVVDSRLPADRTGAVTVRHFVALPGRAYRLDWSIGGTTPSFTFSETVTYQA
jgi:hypothetical protein